jgi:hypothetical protein
MTDSIANKPMRNCDVVMKGGITSGVVYPTAISELAKHFQLRNIGGTSAGAIAAATAAAAQFRAQNGDRTGFDALEGLPAFLGGKNKTGSTNLFTFFQPQKRTKRLFSTLIGALEARGPVSAAFRVFGRTLVRFPLFILLGLIPGAVLVLLGATHHEAELCVAGIVIGLMVLIAGALGGALIALFQHFGKRVPANYFGFCTGMSTDPKNDKEVGPSSAGQALTVWLSKYLNELAGLGADEDPLTFGQLWWPDLPAGSTGPEDEKRIRLEMFTTCLSMGRPFRLPFRREESVRENTWYFRESEFRQFFPGKVVEWMKNHPRKIPADANMDPEYLPMPDPWNLPVVVATRLSLSFPILLSALPLYAPKFGVGLHGESNNPEAVPGIGKASGETQQMLLCWFSDGGICSNFPLHFFDAPIPGWPTFGINLVEKNAEDSDNPWMPPTNNAGIHDRWSKVSEAGIGALFSFIGAIIATMQNWSDNTLSRMPGYRDRIAHVRLTKEEGGLNLQMPAERINHLSNLGHGAAVEFARRFAAPESLPMDWPNHRWIRFRSMLASIVEMAQSIDDRCSNPQPGDESYEDWIARLELNKAPSYRWRSQEQRALAIKTLAALRELGRSWNTAEVDASAGAPRPRPELRPRPRT